MTPENNSKQRLVNRHKIKFQIKQYGIEPNVR
jgi:hypothetical protein